MQTWWHALGRRAQLGLLAGALGILLALGLASWWLWKPDRAVLFSGLRPQDVALLAGELDKLKLPYAVADEGATLLVERSQVHATRMKLMGKELPLHGAVGLELFNTSDFGMNEFAQKVNFQRALQGELTRTILAFAEVQDARVHLALPEQGLFRASSARPKAAITLTLRPGATLRGEQVSGIQRLVAAAVAGLAAGEVTIVDQQGVALSRPAEEGEAGGGSARLDLKRETENYLSRKAGAVLERAFGPGQALASVDATLNMEQVRVTTEDVIAAPDARGGAATGVLVRERESARDTAAPDTRGQEARGGRGSSAQRDADYQAGRRVEQVVSQPGSIRRLQVVAVLRPVLDAAQQEQVRKLVAAAVGASFERGDTVVVQSFAAVAKPEAMPVAPAEAIAPPPASAMSAAAPAVDARLPFAALVLACLLLALAVLLRRRSAREAAPSPLSEQQRRVALRRVAAWLQDPAAADATLLRAGRSRA